MSEVILTHEHVTAKLLKSYPLRYFVTLTLGPDARLVATPTGDELATVLDLGISRIRSVPVETECKPINLSDALIGWHLSFSQHEQLTVAEQAYILGLLLQHYQKHLSYDSQVSVTAGTAI